MILDCYLQGIKEETEREEEKAQPSVAVHGCFEDRERELMKVVLSWLNVVISPQ